MGKKILFATMALLSFLTASLITWLAISNECNYTAAIILDCLIVGLGFGYIEEFRAAR